MILASPTSTNPSPLATTPGVACAPPSLAASPLAKEQSSWPEPSSPAMFRPSPSLVASPPASSPNAGSITPPTNSTFTRSLNEPPGTHRSRKILANHVFDRVILRLGLIVMIEIKHIKPPIPAVSLRVKLIRKIQPRLDHGHEGLRRKLLDKRRAVIRRRHAGIIIPFGNPYRQILPKRGVNNAAHLVRYLRVA